MEHIMMCYWKIGRLMWLLACSLCGCAFDELEHGWTMDCCYFMKLLRIEGRSWWPELGLICALGILEILDL